MTHKQKVLELLRDGRPHTHHELYRLGCVAHSRVSDLRRDGHRIECWTENVRGERVSMYRLLSAAESSQAQAAGSSVPVALNELAESSPNPNVADGAPTCPLRDSDAGQLVLQIPRSAYEAAA